jgi:RNA polymerase sigma-70 factor (ECF subfamily)
VLVREAGDEARVRAAAARALLPDAAEEVLVREARTGDPAAFGLLLERHYPALLHVCRQLVGERALAEDCAQDAAIVAWLRLAHLRSPAAFRAWLTGIGRHTCQHALRARRAAPTLELPGAGDELAARDHDHDHDDSPVTSFEPDLEVAAGRTLREAIDELPPGARAAVRAFYLGELDYAEAALALGISLSALKVRLHDARHRFRLHDPAIRKPKRNARTLAVHEAAHAVLYCRYGSELRRVSIAPVSAVWRASDPERDATRGGLPVVLELQVRMAGEVATLLGGCGQSSGDRDAAGTLALRATGGDQVEAALLLEHARRSAQGVLASSRTWRQVEDVAGRLQAVQTVDGDEVRSVCARTAG